LATEARNIQFGITVSAEIGIVACQLDNKKSVQMPEYILNPAASVEKINHQDPEISVHIVDDFLENSELLVDYARNQAYFGNVGDDRTAYPGIRDRLPRPYERLMEKIVERVYGASNPSIHRCMLSLTTVDPQQLKPAQRIPHIDACGDDQFAAIHFLCGAPHGGTAFYRYRPRDKVRIRDQDRHVIDEMLQQVSQHPQEHEAYLAGDTSFYKQELVVEAKFNRLVLYPSNLLHCALLTAPQSLKQDLKTGRLTVATFFQIESRVQLDKSERHIDVVAK